MKILVEELGLGRVGLAAAPFTDNSKVSTQGNFQIFVEEGFELMLAPMY